VGHLSAQAMKQANGQDITLEDIFFNMRDLELHNQ
jgi:hypothetical protein